ncbi:hypothetical protein C8R43DRAFT_1176677 [Mycena crocata]|nr:hypothetical protein C8R43DRAFT_1176677 [Mycena crocata]
MRDRRCLLARCLTDASVQMAFESDIKMPPPMARCLRQPPVLHLLSSHHNPRDPLTQRRNNFLKREGLLLVAPAALSVMPFSAQSLQLSCPSPFLVVCHRRAASGFRSEQKEGRLRIEGQENDAKLTPITYMKVVYELLLCTASGPLKAMVKWHADGRVVQPLNMLGVLAGRTKKATRRKPHFAHDVTTISRIPAATIANCETLTLQVR